MLRISKMAMTPMWLKKHMYQKLSADVNYELPPIDREDLRARYNAFEQSLN